MPQEIAFISEAQKPDITTMKAYVDKLDPVMIAHVSIPFLSFLLGFSFTVQVCNLTHFVLITGYDTVQVDTFYVNGMVYISLPLPLLMVLQTHSSTEPRISTLTWLTCCCTPCKPNKLLSPLPFLIFQTHFTILLKLKLQGTSRGYVPQEPTNNLLTNRNITKVWTVN